MTKDQFIFENLKRDGERWHEHTIAGGCILREIEDGWFKDTLKCRKKNVNFTTWQGFGWMFERAQEKEWWKEFCLWCHSKHFRLVVTEYIVEFTLGQLAKPTRFRDALASYLGWEKSDGYTKCSFRLWHYDRGLITDNEI